MENVKRSAEEVRRNRQDRNNQNKNHNRHNRHNRYNQQKVSGPTDSQIKDLISGKISIDDLHLSRRELDYLVTELDRIEKMTAPIDSKLGSSSGSNNMRKMRIDNYRNERNQKIELIARLVVLATMEVSGLSSWYLGEKINDGSLRFKILSIALKAVGGFTLIAAPVITYML